MGKPSNYYKGLRFSRKWIKDKMSITMGRPLSSKRSLIPLKKMKKDEKILEHVISHKQLVVGLTGDDNNL